MSEITKMFNFLCYFILNVLFVFSVLPHKHAHVDHFYTNDVLAKWHKLQMMNDHASQKNE